jgi:flagellar assembly protein FliH
MAGIIKATGRDAPPSRMPLKAFHFENVGQAYLDRVRAEAARLVAEARREAERIRAQAAEEGRKAALRAVEAAMRPQLEQQLASAAAAMKQAVQAILHARHAWQQHWQQHAVALALAIARRICRGELSRRPQIPLAWVREALELVVGDGQVLLRLNPQDHAKLAGEVHRLANELAGLGSVQIVADPQIESGGCRVETQFGSLDQQLEAQLGRLRQELLD